MDSADYPQYTFQHSSTGVLAKTAGIECIADAKAYIEELEQLGTFFFPEGSWTMIGVRHYTEEW